jgi:hypothetical protein
MDRRRESVRTVIWFGMASLADAVGNYSNWEPGADYTFVAVGVLIFALILDIIEAFKPPQV